MILKEMIKKTTEDTNWNIEAALAWDTSAKNTLHSVHDYNPIQFVFSKNPSLNDKLYSYLFLVKTQHSYIYNEFDNIFICKV